MNMGHHGIWGKGNGTFPLNLYDTAVKVPLLISWPGRIPMGRVSGRMCSQYDFMPTLLDLLDIPAQLPDSLPGRSFQTALLHPDCEEEDGAVVVFDEYGPNRMIRTREWKLVHRYPYGPDELYHLSADPGEEHNLIDREECQEIRAQLLDQLIRWFDRYVDQGWSGQGGRYRIRAAPAVRLLLGGQAGVLSAGLTGGSGAGALRPGRASPCLQQKEADSPPFAVNWIGIWYGGCLSRRFTVSQLGQLSFGSVFEKRP